MRRLGFLRTVAIFFMVSLIYLCNDKTDPKNGDSLAFRYLPYSMLKEFDFDLDEFYQYLLEHHPWLTYTDASGEKLPYYLIKVKGHYLSTSGIGPAILALPILFIPIKFFHYSPDSQLIVFLTKFTASILIALSAVLIFLSVRALSGTKKALLLMFIYALCSGMWSISSQELYQQTSSEFFLALSIYFLFKGLKNSKFIPYTGFSLGLASIMRPTSIIVFLIMSIYIFHQYRDKLLKYILYSFGPLLFMAWYNYYYHGSIFLFPQMIYNPIGALYKTGSSNMWSTPLFLGFSGLLISPSRGLFIYSPVFIFSFFGMILVWKQKRELIFKYFSIAVLAIIIIQAKWYDWWGGWTFGCRALNDAIPFLIFFLLPILDYIKQKRALFPLFILSVIFSFFVQIVGAFLYDNSWNKNPDIDLNQYRLWLWKESQLSHYLKIILAKRN